MNTSISNLALVAILAGTSHAAISGKKSAFMDKQQLAAMRAEASFKPAGAPPEREFFTGRPFLPLSSEYAFKYRSYSPGIARWTSDDPSGFPDGANQASYAPTPTSDLDVGGLLKWSTLSNTGSQQTWSHGGNQLISDVWTVRTDDSSAVITLWANTTATAGSIAGFNYRFNCHGYTFGNSAYWINGQVDAILKGDGYKLITGDDRTGARVGYWGGDVHTAVVNSVSPEGVVTAVTGKLGAEPLLYSTPAGQGYGGSIEYYE